MSLFPTRAWRLGQLDLCRLHGIPFDRTTLPPDDDITDLAAWLAGVFDTQHADITLWEPVVVGSVSPAEPTTHGDNYASE